SPRRRCGGCSHPRCGAAGSYPRAYGREWALRDRLARRDDARVEAEQVQTAVEAGVLDLEAAVHDDREAMLLAVAGRLLVVDAELHPDRLRADREHVVDHRGDV